MTQSCEGPFREPRALGVNRGPFGQRCTINRALMCDAKAQVWRLFTGRSIWTTSKTRRSALEGCSFLRLAEDWMRLHVYFVLFWLWLPNVMKQRITKETSGSRSLNDRQGQTWQTSKAGKSYWSTWQVWALLAEGWVFVSFPIGRSQDTQNKVKSFSMSWGVNSFMMSWSACRWGTQFQHSFTRSAESTEAVGKQHVGLKRSAYRLKSLPLPAVVRWQFAGAVVAFGTVTSWFP